MKAVDLFAGCGGLTLGLEDAVYEVVCAVDNWEPALAIYKLNFSHPAESLDLSDVQRSTEIVSTYKPEVIVGGPPCQDYSSAGKRDETLGRADLTLSFTQIVCSVKSRFFIMENVDRIVKAKTYEKALDVFKAAGYGITARTLDASLCGAPQKRKRHFVVGALDVEDGFLDGILQKHLAKQATTIRDYLGESLGVEDYYRHPRNYNRRGVFSIDEPSPTIRGVNRPIPKGYKGHKNDTSKDYENLRPLTTKERSLLQTFPESFQLVGSKTNVEQALGNAVPVKLAEYVGMCLKEYVKLGALRENTIFIHA